VHRQSQGVALGYLFETLGLGVNQNCFIFQDGREFCTNEDYSMKYYINHELVPEINDYVGKEGDRILISYGDEDQDGIDVQLAELDGQPLLG
jgi:hypothetical protein